MSQTSGTAGDGFAAQSPKAVSSGRAVLLLALAVILGVVLLHELDNTPTATAPAVKHEPAAATPPPANNQAPVTPQLRTPSEVKVLVANGTNVNGAANKVAGRLQPIGYQLLKPGNTTAPSGQSIVQYAPGYQPEAQALATSLGIAATAVQQMPIPAPIADLQGANVVVIIGNELAGQQPTTQGAASTNPVNNGPLSPSTTVLNQQAQTNPQTPIVQR